MQKHAIKVLTGIFLTVCLVICAMVFYSVHALHQVRQEYDELNSDREQVSGTIKRLEARNAILKRIEALKLSNAHGQPDAIAYLTTLRGLIESNGITLMNMSTSGGNDERPDSEITVKLDGNYYQIVRLLAQIRTSPSVARITAFSVKRNHDLPEELVEVDMKLEIFLEES